MCVCVSQIKKPSCHKHTFSVFFPFSCQSRTILYPKHTHAHTPVCIPCIIIPYVHTVLWGAADDSGGGERKNNADTALSSVMAPQATCLSGLLCAASLSFITGHDGLHQLILTEQETIISLSASLSVRLILSTSICHVTHLYTCRISVWFGSSLTKEWYWQDRVQIPVHHSKQCFNPSSSTMCSNGKPVSFDHVAALVIFDLITSIEINTYPL